MFLSSSISESSILRISAGISRTEDWVLSFSLDPVYIQYLIFLIHISLQPDVTNIDYRFNIIIIMMRNFNQPFMYRLQYQVYNGSFKPLCVLWVQTVQCTDCTQWTPEFSADHTIKHIVVNRALHALKTLSLRQTDGENKKSRIIYPTTSPSAHKV